MIQQGSSLEAELEATKSRLAVLSVDQQQMRQQQQSMESQVDLAAAELEAARKEVEAANAKTAAAYAAAAAANAKAAAANAKAGAGAKAAAANAKAGAGRSADFPSPDATSSVKQKSRVWFTGIPKEIPRLGATQRSDISVSKPWFQGTPMPTHTALDSHLESNSLAQSPLSEPATHVAPSASMTTETERAGESLLAYEGAQAEDGPAEELSTVVVEVDMQQLLQRDSASKQYTFNPKSSKDRIGSGFACTVCAACVHVLWYVLPVHVLVRSTCCLCRTGTRGVSLCVCGRSC